MTARDTLRALVEADPTLTQSQLATLLGVTRQRVSQLVRAEGLTVRKGPPGVGERSPANAPQSRVLTGGVPTPISHTVAGLIGELLTAADLMARGYTVFFPLSRTAVCDLVAIHRTGSVLTIEVRCATRKGDRLVWSRKDSSLANHFALVVTGEPVSYEPPLP